MHLSIFTESLHSPQCWKGLEKHMMYPSLFNTPFPNFQKISLLNEPLIFKNERLLHISTKCILNRSIPMHTISSGLSPPEYFVYQFTTIIEKNGSWRYFFQKGFNKKIQLKINLDRCVMLQR